MVDNNNVPKNIEVLLLLKIFFSEKGNKKIPIIINIGSLTESQISKYVGGKSVAYITLPKVIVPTLLW